ncbi:MAG: SDR family oxidoreductase [Bacteroidetes bacterium]|nr:SDR family oxidoreductase [Bacteroidota bacterium]
MSKVLITGGTRGIGRELIEIFASNGFDIATCSRNEKDLNNLVKEIGVTFKNIDFFAYQCDVSKKNDIINFGENVLKNFGIPDLLINNAGIFIPGTISTETDNIFETHINTNIASAYHLTRILLPEMKKNKNGFIFNMCSTASITAYTGSASYCISKFAMLGFSKLLREELKPYGIKVCSVMPGATLTSSWEGTSLPIDRFINSKELADLMYSVYKNSNSMDVEELIIRPLKGDVNENNYNN